jgi:hypothetical protein
MPDETGYGTQDLTAGEREELERLLANAREIQLARLERRETRLQAKARVPSGAELEEQAYCAALARKILARELEPGRFFGDEEVRLPSGPAGDDTPHVRNPKEEAAYCAGLQKQIVARELAPENFFELKPR